MEMVGHQYVSIKIKWIALTDNPQRFQKGVAIGFPKKDPLPVIAAGYDMVEKSFSRFVLEELGVSMTLQATPRE